MTHRGDAGLTVPPTPPPFSSEASVSGNLPYGLHMGQKLQQLLLHKEQPRLLQLSGGDANTPTI